MIEKRNITVDSRTYVLYAWNIETPNKDLANEE